MARGKMASASGVLALVNRIEDVAKTMQKICKDVYGNGEPGMKQDLAVIKGQLKIVVWLLGACITGIVVPLAVKAFGG